MNLGVFVDVHKVSEVELWGSPRCLESWFGLISLQRLRNLGKVFATFSGLYVKPPVTQPCCKMPSCPELQLSPF